MAADLTRILYADDEEDILNVASMALEMLGGFSVTTCGNGFDAIAEARRNPPDLIMLDVMMPRMDGPETLSRIRADALLSEVPVLLMTARVRDVEMDDYLARGADGVISKPFDPMTLADEVRRVWNKAMAKRNQMA